MSSKGMSLKGRINNYAKQNGIAAQVILQNFMFERFLERLSRSGYQQKFVIKGGMLVTAIVGIDTRATMDLDTTLRNLPLTEAQIREIEAAQNKPAVEDEDCPELDPQKTPELWDEMMKSLAERNRKMARRMA